MQMIRFSLAVCLLFLVGPLAAQQALYSLEFRAPETGGQWVEMMAFRDTSGSRREPNAVRVQRDAERQAGRYCQPNPLWYDDAEAAASAGLVGGTRRMADYVPAPLERQRPDAIRVTYWDGRTAVVDCE